MKPHSEEQPPLSPYWAFVVQFRLGTTVDAGQFIGRVEHVVSGQATDFQALEELLAFVGQMLGEVGGPPS